MVERGAGMPGRCGEDVAQVGVALLDAPDATAGLLGTLERVVGCSGGFVPGASKLGAVTVSGYPRHGCYCQCFALRGSSKGDKCPSDFSCYAMRRSSLGG